MELLRRWHKPPQSHFEWRPSNRSRIWSTKRPPTDEPRRFRGTVTTRGLHSCGLKPKCCLQAKPLAWWQPGDPADLASTLGNPAIVAEGRAEAGANVQSVSEIMPKNKHSHGLDVLANTAYDSSWHSALILLAWTPDNDAWVGSNILVKINETMPHIRPDRQVLSTRLLLQQVQEIETLPWTQVTSSPLTVVTLPDVERQKGQVGWQYLSPGLRSCCSPYMLDYSHQRQ